MALQKTIGTELAIGVPGTLATLNPSAYTIVNPIAEEDINVGTFVWFGDDETTAKYGGTVLAGFATAPLAYHGFDIRQEAYDIAPEGYQLSVATKGDFYAISTTDAALGDKVFAIPDDGTLETGASSASGGVDTGWTVTRAGDAGDVIVISR